MFTVYEGNTNVRHRVQVNDYEMPLLRFVFQNDLTIQNAYHLLHNMLFENGLVVIPKEGRYNVDKPAPDVVMFLYNRYCLPFLKDALQSFLIYGYVTGTMVTSPVPEFGNKLFVHPVFVPPEKVAKTRVTLKSWHVLWEVVERKEVQVQLYKPGEQLYIPPPDSGRYFIAFFDGYEPDPITGCHLSPVKNVLPESSSMKQRSDSHLIATTQRARPTVVVGHSVEKPRHEGTLSATEMSNPALFHRSQQINNVRNEVRAKTLEAEDQKEKGNR